MKLPSVREWETPPVHPVNDAPMMSPSELQELAQDIKQHGLEEPITLWRDNSGEAKGEGGPWPEFLLDGRNRLAALELIGIDDPTQAPPAHTGQSLVRTYYAIKMVQSLSLTQGAGKERWVKDVDPRAYHLSRNVYRRHLTAEQRRWEIKRAIAKNPKASDREIARQAKVHHETVAATRAEMSGPNGGIRQTDHRPIERAKAALQANPKMTQRELQKKAKVGASTAVAAHRALDKMPEVRPAPKLTKKREAEQASEELADWLVEMAKQKPTVATWLRLGAKQLSTQLMKRIKKGDVP